MKLLAEQHAEIACPVESAYRLACNLERFGDWFPGVVAIESGNDLAHATVGKRYVETVDVPLRGARKVDIVVKEAEPNRLLVTEGNLAPILPRMEIRFEPAGTDACAVRWRMYSRSPGALARMTVVPLAARVMRKRAAVGMARLKKLLEAAR
jgi:carbon monoxide dehydrogenase subunit G